MPRPPAYSGSDTGLSALKAVAGRQVAPAAGAKGWGRVRVLGVGWGVGMAAALREKEAVNYNSLAVRANKFRLFQSNIRNRR